jgi:N-acetylglucosaminyldiphosphoundecaprenol N-acetyl-beta-D-mannosaminyltransferase
MIDAGRKNILGVMVDAVDYEAAVQRISDAAVSRRHFAGSALAVHGVMTGALDEVHRFRLNHLDLAVPDGQPVRWAIRALHRTQLPDRVYGPNLMLALCQRLSDLGISVYLYGSRPEVLSALERNLERKLPGLMIAGSEPSRFRRLDAQERLEVAARITASGAGVVFVGLGCPRQETWAFEYRNLISLPILAVGAAFDFHAGLTPQAPRILQRVGLEWLFRLVHEPRRLWRRYVLLNPRYVWMVLLQLLGIRRYGANPGVAPTEVVGIG